MFKTLVIPMALAVISTSVYAGSISSTRIGNTSIYSNGMSSTDIGNQTLYSNGSSSTHIGNHSIHSNGSSSTRIGNNTINSNGTSSTRIGNSTLHSDGTTCTTIYSNTICNQEIKPSVANKKAAQLIARRLFYADKNGQSFFKTDKSSNMLVNLSYSQGSASLIAWS